MSWRYRLKVDPVPCLLSCDSEAINYWTKRDLLGEETGPPSALWDLPIAKKVLLKQRPDGSWKYPGGGKDLRTQGNYDQLETFRQLGELVEKYGFTREHPAIGKAAGFLFTFQTGEGDFRGIYGSQYATTYQGAIMEVLIKAGYARDPRIEKGFQWLLAMRQGDGGWAIPLRTAGLKFADFGDAMTWPEPVPPVRSKPFSHLITGMVLRAFATHPAHRRSAAAKEAGELLAASLYRRDAYPDRGDASYWERVSFPFWFTDVVGALDSLYYSGFTAGDPRIAAALERLRNRQAADGTFDLKYLKGGSDKRTRSWVCLAIARLYQRYYMPQADGQ